MKKKVTNTEAKARRQRQNRLFTALCLCAFFGAGIAMLLKNPPDFTSLDLTDVTEDSVVYEDPEPEAAEAGGYDASELEELLEEEPELTEEELFARQLLAKDSADWELWCGTSLQKRAHEAAENVHPHFQTVDASYFDDALFFGDSRVQDIQYHGGLDGATWCVKDGFSIFNMQKESIYVRGYGKITYIQCLQEREWGKIYLWTGANEAWANVSDLETAFTKVYHTIREYCPNAIIYLCAPQHVSAWKNANSDCTNAKLNAIADILEKLSEEDDRTFFIDINPLFDDENGCLPSDTTKDGVHMYMSYYSQWIEWLCQHAIVLDNADTGADETADTADTAETGENTDGTAAAAPGET